MAVTPFKKLRRDELFTRFSDFRMARSLWFEPLHEPRYRRLTSGWRDGVASLLLNEQLELILRPGIGVGLARARGAIHHARHRRSRVRIAVDHQQRAWRDERQHCTPMHGTATATRGSTAAAR